MIMSLPPYSTQDQRRPTSAKFECPSTANLKFLRLGRAFIKQSDGKSDTDSIRSFLKQSPELVDFGLLPMYDFEYIVHMIQSEHTYRPSARTGGAMASSVKSIDGAVTPSTGTSMRLLPFASSITTVESSASPCVEPSITRRTKRRRVSNQAPSPPAGRGKTRHGSTNDIISRVRHASKQCDMLPMLSVPQPAPRNSSYNGVVRYWSNTDNDRLNVFSKASADSQHIRHDSEFDCFDAGDILRYLESCGLGLDICNDLGAYMTERVVTTYPGHEFTRPVQTSAVIEIANACEILPQIQSLLDLGESHDQLVQEYRCTHCGCAIKAGPSDNLVAHVAIHVGGIHEDVLLVRCPYTGCNAFGDRTQENTISHIRSCKFRRR